MSQRRQYSSSRSARAAPAGDVLLSPARQTRSSSRLADSSDPPVTRSKTSQSSTLSRSSRLARHNSAPAKSLVPAKSAVPAAKTRDALLLLLRSAGNRRSGGLHMVVHLLNFGHHWILCQRFLRFLLRLRLGHPLQPTRKMVQFLALWMVAR